MADIDWTKIIVTAGGAAILALQGVNLNATHSAETQVEGTEKTLLQRMYELEQKMSNTAEGTNKLAEKASDTAEENKKMLEAISEKLTLLVHPTPSPTSQ